MATPAIEVTVETPAESAAPPKKKHLWKKPPQKGGSSAEPAAAETPGTAEEVNSADAAPADGAAAGEAMEIDDETKKCLQEHYGEEFHAKIEELSADKGKGERRVPIGLRNNLNSFKTMGALPKLVALQPEQPAAPLVVNEKDLESALKGYYPPQLHKSMKSLLTDEGEGADKAASRRIPIGLRNNVASFKTMTALNAAVAAPPAEEEVVAEVMKSAYPAEMHSQIEQHLKAEGGASSRRVPIGLRNNVTSFKTMGVLPKVQQGTKRQHSKEGAGGARKKPVMLGAMPTDGDLKVTMKTLYPEHLHAKLDQHLEESGGRVPIGLRNQVTSFRTMAQLPTVQAPAPAPTPAQEKDLKSYYPEHLHGKLQQHLTSTNLAGLLAKKDGSPAPAEEVHIPIGLRNKMLATPVEKWDTMFAGVSEEVKQSLKLCLIAH